MSDGMPVPEWAKNANEQVAKIYEGIDYGKSEGAAVRKLVFVDSFTSHFAEFEIKKDDLLVHLFPRRGDGDRWYPASYDNKGAYRPARREIKVEGCAFPDDMSYRIQKASDYMWQGSVAIELVPELGAYVVQFQGAKNTVKVVGVDKFVDKFCEQVDKQLDAE